MSGSRLDDPARLAALARTELLASGAEEVFDRFTRLAARLLGAPIATITLVDSERQHVKSAVGELGDPLPASQSYCQHVVRTQAPFVVADVRRDARMADSAEVLDEAGLVSYCGVPLTGSDGHTLGSLCTMDGAPRQWSEDDIDDLRELAASAMTEVELRLAYRRLDQHERENRELHERQARLAGVVEAAEEAINLVDLDGRVMGWNPACERLYGWTALEVIGRPLVDVGFLVEDTDGQSGFALDARALAGESVAAKRLRRRRKDGSIIYVDISLTPLHSGDGEIVGVTAVARDVTDRQRLSLELEASERRFRHTFDHAPTGVSLVALDRRLIDVNRAFCELIGYEREELIGRTLEGITDPADHAADVAGARGMVTGSTPNYRIEKRYRHKSGRTVWVRLSASLVRGEHGEPRYFIAHTEDITASREAQDALREARSLLDESQAVARVGSWSYDLETGALSWSTEQFHLHGFDPAGQAPSIDDLCERLHRDEREAFRGAMRSLLARPRDFSAEYRVALPDGRVHTLATSAQVLGAEPAQGRRARVSGTTRDVTAEREAQAAQAAIEQRHRRLLHGLPDTMVILYDADERLVSMQGGLISAAGIDVGRYVGRTMEEVTAGDRSRTLPPLLRRALAGESITIDHDTGQGRQFQIAFAPYTDEDGEIIGAMTVWRDVTARLARENENRMLAAMIGQSQDAMIAKDADGRVTEWNGGAERIYGYTREEAVGRLLRDLIIPPELHQQEIDGNAHVMAGGSLHVEARRVRKDGSTLHVSISVNPLRDADGEVTGIFVSGRDITERVREQTARRQIEDRLRVTVEHAPIGVALVDLRSGADGRLLSFNESFVELVGDVGAADEGVSLSSLVHPDDAGQLREELAGLAADPAGRLDREVRFLAADGRIVWVLVTGAPVPAESGPPRLAVLHALDIGERKRFEGQLQHLADHDTLTGVYNRRRFESELTRTVALSRRYGYESALLMIDLDGFKNVNDTMGHSYGDELIARVASCLRDCLRETDVIGRLGGDEFAVILASADEQAAVIVAEKLLQAIAENGIVTSESRHASVTASIGVAPFDGESSQDADSLLVEADLAMYAAKDSGRNQLALAARGATEPPTLSVERSWLHRLRAALDLDHFELFAQPIRSICTDPGDSYELLLRLRDDDGELIAPAAFLHNAERFDLVQEIDRWVFGRALALLSARADSDLCLSVNMSGRTLCDPRLVDDLTAMVAACPIPRDRLVVEVTETAAIVHIERAREVARALRALGCRFALDDFGSGFASYYYLKHLEFDFVKIDGEFVKALVDDPTDELVVRSVVDLARGLGARTVAEFVGDDETVARLRALGVDHGQGFHLGRPGPVDQVLPAPLVAGSA